MTKANILRVTQMAVEFLTTLSLEPRITITLFQNALKMRKSKDKFLKPEWCSLEVSQDAPSQV